MSARAFGEAPIALPIADAAHSPTLAVLVGAGASIEARLPNWATLVERLRRRAASIDPVGSPVHRRTLP